MTQNHRLHLFRLELEYLIEPGHTYFHLKRVLLNLSQRWMVSEAMRVCAFPVRRITVNMSKHAATLGWTKTLYATLSQSWWTTQITTMSFIWNCLVSYLRLVTRIATSLRLTPCITRPQITEDNDCKERTLLLNASTKKWKISRFHSNTYRSHMISRQAFCNSLIHTGSRWSNDSNTLTLVRKRDWTNSCRLEPLWSLTIQYSNRM